MSQLSKYENKSHLHQYMLNRFLRHIKSAVDESGATRILEAGCADGYVIRYLGNYDKLLEFYGVDIDLEALKRAREMNPGIDFGYGDVETDVLPRERFDLVLVLEVLEHIPDTEKVFLNMQKLDVKHLLISVPREPFFRMLNFLRGRHWKRLGNHPEHVHVWGKSEFKKIVSKYFMIKKDYSSFPWTIFLLTKKDLT